MWRCEVKDKEITPVVWNGQQRHSGVFDSTIQIRPSGSYSLGTIWWQFSSMIYN